MLGARSSVQRMVGAVAAKAQTQDIAPSSGAGLMQSVVRPSPKAAGEAAWKTMRIIQGEYVVSRFADACLTTLLGSCVATCLWDPVLKLGGMNHYLLPGGGASDAGQLRYGVNAMELLVNGMLKRGAHKSQLVAKIFGGASMLNVKSDIGARNVAFAKQFLADEGIAVVGGSLGGGKGRLVRFFPADGRAQQKFVRSEDLPEIELVSKPKFPEVATTGTLQLF
ncbi:MAG: chemotaxis protein CheD [Sulfitobacter sp.]|jgi:chemotaxis protein CheD